MSMDQQLFNIYKKLCELIADAQNLYVAFVNLSLKNSQLTLSLQTPPGKSPHRALGEIARSRPEEIAQSQQQLNDNKNDSLHRKKLQQEDDDDDKSSESEYDEDGYKIFKPLKKQQLIGEDLTRLDVGGNKFYKPPVDKNRNKPPVRPGKSSHTPTGLQGLAGKSLLGVPKASNETLRSCDPHRALDEIARLSDPNRNHQAFDSRSVYNFDDDKTLARAQRDRVAEKRKHNNNSEVGSCDPDDNVPVKSRKQISHEYEADVRKHKTPKSTDRYNSVVSSVSSSKKNKTGPREEKQDHFFKQMLEMLDQNEQETGKKCPFCGVYLTGRAFCIHVKKKHIEDRCVKCVRCNQICKNKQDLITHIKRKHQTFCADDLVRNIDWHLFIELKNKNKNIVDSIYNYFCPKDSDWPVEIPKTYYCKHCFHLTSAESDMRRHHNKHRHPGLCDLVFNPKLLDLLLGKYENETPSVQNLLRMFKEKENLKQLLQKQIQLREQQQAVRSRRDVRDVSPEASTSESQGQRQQEKGKTLPITMKTNHAETMPEQGLLETSVTKSKDKDEQYEQDTTTSRSNVNGAFLTMLGDSIVRANRSHESSCNKNPQFNTTLPNSDAVHVEQRQVFDDVKSAAGKSLLGEIARTPVLEDRTESATNSPASKNSVRSDSESDTSSNNGSNKSSNSSSSNSTSTKSSNDNNNNNNYPPRSNNVRTDLSTIVDGYQNNLTIESLVKSINFKNNKVRVSQSPKLSDTDSEDEHTENINRHTTERSKMGFCVVNGQQQQQQY